MVLLTAVVEAQEYASGDPTSELMRPFLAHFHDTSRSFMFKKLRVVIEPKLKRREGKPKKRRGGKPKKRRGCSEKKNERRGLKRRRRPRGREERLRRRGERPRKKAENRRLRRNAGGLKPLRRLRKKRKSGRNDPKSEGLTRRTLLRL